MFSIFVLCRKHLHMLKERTSPVWITSRPPDASLEQDHYKDGKTCERASKTDPRRRREGRNRRSFSMTAHWAASCPRIDLDQEMLVEAVDILGFKMNLSTSHHCFWELSMPRNPNLWFFPHFGYLVMPPGPGPTSTTWHPARDPPDLATLSSSRGSNIKFWESRFWAWTMDIKLRPSSHSHFPTLIL